MLLIILFTSFLLLDNICARPFTPLEYARDQKIPDDYRDQMFDFSGTFSGEGSAEFSQNLFPIKSDVVSSGTSDKDTVPPVVLNHLNNGSGDLDGDANGGSGVEDTSSYLAMLITHLNDKFNSTYFILDSEDNKKAWKRHFLFMFKIILEWNDAIVWLYCMVITIHVILPVYSKILQMCQWCLGSRALDTEVMAIIWWSNICGQRNAYDAFWNPSLTINTTNPDLTNCFQQTALPWTSLALLLSMSVFYVPFVRAAYENRVYKSSTRTRQMRLLCMLLMLLLCLIELTYALVKQFDKNENDIAFPVEYIVVFTKAATFILLIALELWTTRQGIHSPSIVFFYWTLTLIFGIVTFRSKILQLQNGYPVEMVLYVTFYINFALVLISFVTCLIPGKPLVPASTPDKHDRNYDEHTPLLDADKEQYQSSHNHDNVTMANKKQCPRLKAPFLSILTFTWMIKKVWYGFRRNIEWDDIWDIRYQDSCDCIVPVFEKEWNKELDKKRKTISAKQKFESLTYYQQNEPNSQSKRFEESQSEKDDTVEKEKSKRPSGSLALAFAIARSFPIPLVCCALLLLCDYGFSMFNPFILQLLINFVEDEDAYNWKGYFYAVAMFVCTVASVMCAQHSINLEYIIGIQVRSALTSLIYKKALKISPVARKGYTSGEIVNLMSVDVQKLQDAPVVFNFIWSTPIMIAVIMYFIWQYLGPASLAGLAVILILLPANSLLLASKMRTLQADQMAMKDKRLKLVNQVLGGIKVLKLYAWEPYFDKKVQDIRNEELKAIKMTYVFEAIIYCMYFCSPFLVALSCFATYVLSDDTHVLDAETAFVSMALFNLLNFPLTVLPWSIMFMIQATVSFKRVSTFLLSEDLDPDNVQQGLVQDAAVSIRNGKFSWGEGDRSPLEGINMNVPHGKLVAVVGQVGCGKSSLISAMLGEMIRLEGTVSILGSTSYFPQQAWIQNMTLKNNIVFSKPLIESKYQQIIQACALEPDLKILPGGDQTEIGERGINLSGGQKARVSLARAVYQDNDIYLLDDPLSAVDAHVGKDIFNNVIGKGGLLEHKSRILVTNQLTFLPYVDEIIVLNNGMISETGSYEELLSHDGAFAEFVRTYLQETEENDAQLDEEDKQLRVRLQQQISVISSKSGGGLSDCDSRHSQQSESKSSLRKRKRSRKSTTRQKSRTEEKKSIKDKKPDMLITEEIAEAGNIKPAVIKGYIKAATLINTGLTVFSVIVFIIAQATTNIWLSDWSNDKPVNGTMDRDLINLRLGVYGGLGFLQAVGISGIAFGIALGAVAASKKLHNELLHNILKCPMAFFDTTPLGRIVNRFSKDIDIIDSNLPQSSQNLMTTLAPMFATIIIIIYSLPIFIAILIPIAIIFIIIQRIYVSCARQLKRYDSIKRSPIYAFFNESLSGVSSIRAYKQQDRFIYELEQKLDDSQRVWYEVITTNRWLSIYAELLGDIIILFIAIFVVLQRDSIDPGIVGLTISFSLQFSNNLVWSLRSTSELETYIVAVERVQEYTQVEMEAPWHIPDCTPPTDWPEQGVVTFNNVSTRYRPGLELVLKDVSFKVNSGEKVGVVGRTGAGKSSMTLSLFRIIEAVGGSIEIDGRNIANIGLHDVRSKLTIIPQDPVLFSGSLKFNIDPSGSYSKGALDTAVEHAHLKDFVQTLPKGLGYECGEDGENLSVGQRQLVCLARALLRKTKILVLDEATASVDLETDELIQATIRTEFQDCTVITIAHRLNTIMDYDRLIIMSGGEIKEFESPGKLLEDTNSLFYSMAKDAGLA